MLRAAETYKAFPDVKRYKDFRKMLDENDSDIDAVTVTTPDHTHAVIAMTAIRMGKHVFVQKPLTHTVYEARMLAEAAREEEVITQMGNQGHAGEGARLINEWIWDGAIGEVHEVHTWTNRPVWPQNIERPEAIPSVPPTLDWNLWLGPAPWRHYHPAYLPFDWRGWWDFGVGALGDMAPHIIDHPFWALDLGYPDTIQATSTPFNKETYPLASVITYTFPARGEKPPVKLKWFETWGLCLKLPCDARWAQVSWPIQRSSGFFARRTGPVTAASEQLPRSFANDLGSRPRPRQITSSW